MYTSQAGGIGAQATFTGPDATRILQRLSDFPATIHEHPVGYEIEAASYNTIPIPGPTAEQNQDRQLVLQDCLNQKMSLLGGLADLDLLLSENAALLFEDLPPESELLTIQRQYRTVLNGLMAHAIKVSNGEMDPPQMFVADPTAPPLHFKKRPWTGATIAGVWEMNFPNNAESRWTVSLVKDNRYQAVETGLGNATGVAVLEGKQVQLDWAATNPGDQTTGRFVWELDDTFTFATATCEFLTVHQNLGILKGRFTRIP